MICLSAQDPVAAPPDHSWLVGRGDSWIEAPDDGGRMMGHRHAKGKLRQESTRPLG